jgi:hypothetical protein
LILIKNKNKRIIENSHKMTNQLEYFVEFELTEIFESDKDEFNSAVLTFKKFQSALSN